jgi:benzoyl-CoA-dihydrodiol lyase
VDKRKVRRDLADVFCTLEEGVKGTRTVDWRLVDELVPTSRFDESVKQRAREFAEASDRPMATAGVTLTELQRTITDNEVVYSSLKVRIDRDRRLAEVTILGPGAGTPASIDDIVSAGADFWPLRLVRELDDALLHLRLNETEIGTLVIKSEGDPGRVDSFERLLLDNADHWLIREIILYWKRTLKRLDVTSRTTFALIEPGSCFSGFLAELIFAADRAYMLDGEFENRSGEIAVIRLSEFNFGPLPMANGITRLQTRFLGEPKSVDRAKDMTHQDLDASAALRAGLVTYAPDDIDWHDEIRLLLEERMSFSADSLTGMEANLRFAGPETMETKIFGRLSAWQNWIFTRPNATGDEGALTRYGQPEPARFDWRRT